MLNIRQILFSNIFLKASSFIIAFIFWSILSKSYNLNTWVNIPIYFYNTDQLFNIKSSDTILVALSGKKHKILKKLNKTDNKKKLAVYINAQELYQGKNIYTLTDKNLFLPEEIKLADQRPKNLVIELIRINQDKL